MINLFFSVISLINIGLLTVCLLTETILASKNSNTASEILRSLIVPGMPLVVVLVLSITIYIYTVSRVFSTK